MGIEGWVNERLQPAMTMATVWRLVGLWLLYRVALALYNISPLHPLHRFPGPRLAAASFLYEFWYDAILWGRYTTEIERMHATYGPIVRINPEELHCNDGDFIDEIYGGSGRIRDKHQHFLNATAGPMTQASFSTRYHEIHRIRRNALNKSFSRSQMKALEPEIHVLVQQFCDKLLGWHEPINLTTAFGCFTVDTISKYCFGETRGFISQHGWKKNYRGALDGLTNCLFIFRFAPILGNLAAIGPLIQDYLPEDMSNLFKELTINMPRYVRSATEGDAKGRVFSNLIESDMPDSEKTIYRLSGEGFSLITAGMETTAATLALVTYYLLAHPDIHARLLEELKGLDPHNLDWQDLESRVYLYAIIQEGIRLVYGAASRLPRIARTENLIYNSKDGKYQYVVPMGTPIGMSSRITHHREEYFPDSYTFNPERWIGSDGKRNMSAEKYITTFSRGSRQCMGMNLAMCELHLMTAAITLRVLPKMKLYKTTAVDVEYDHDLVIPMVKKGSEGIRVVVSR